jgi:hypothetical protein
MIYFAIKEHIGRHIWIYFSINKNYIIIINQELFYWIINMVPVHNKMHAALLLNSIPYLSPENETPQI